LPYNPETPMTRILKRLGGIVERLARWLEPWKARLGRITLGCGIGMVLLGFPAQIYSNWKAAECGIDGSYAIAGSALSSYTAEHEHHQRGL